MKRFLHFLLPANTVGVLLFALVFITVGAPHSPAAGSSTTGSHASPGIAPGQVELYVSPGGNDLNPGTVQMPFLTLERARDEIRALKKSGRSGNGITVWLRGGDHLFTQSFELNAADSGTPEAPVTWRAFPGERVRFLGGRPVTGFQPVTDRAVLAKLDSSAGQNVLVAGLKANGIHHAGTLRSRGFARQVVPAHGELFFGAEPMTLARWPNAGEWELIRDFPTGEGSDDGHGTIMGNLAAGFYYNNERPFRWENTGNIWVHGYWAYDWANSYERIAGIEPGRRFLRTAEPYGNYGFHRNQRFYYLNILEELDQPGEWYIDETAGLLYFWPPSPVDGSELIFSLLETPLVRMDSVSHLTIRGIVFEACRGTAIEIAGGENSRIHGCIIRNTGNHAVTISAGKGHGVIHCDITNTGDGGVIIEGGNRQTLEPALHFVENCMFRNQGRWSKCYVPAISMTGVGLRASHNLIYDHPHCAILFWGNDHLIEYNDIHHVAMETGDVGAIYTGRDYTFRGNRIIHNYIHETGGVGMGSMGVYMDDCVSGTEVTGNIFYKVHWAMFIGGGRDHRVINNLFADCDPAVRADGRGLDTKPVWRNMVANTMRERFYAVPSGLYFERYPEMKSLAAYYGTSDEPAFDDGAFQGIPPEGNVIARNVCIGDWSEITWHAKPEIFDIRDNFVTSDFSQAGSPESGFQLPEGSPAFDYGFVPIPFHLIGLKKSEERDNLDLIR